MVKLASFEAMSFAGRLKVVIKITVALRAPEIDSKNGLVVRAGTISF